MAIIAIIATGNMGCVLACCRSAIVAGSASAEDLSVINGDRGLKGRRAMAIFTDIGGLNVHGALADRGCTVVAAHAVANDAFVIETGR